MNALLLRKFSPQIVRGAQSLGFDFQMGQACLSCDEAEVLEKQTNHSIGQLALLGIEAAASPEQRERQRGLLRSTMELMAAFDQRDAAGREPHKAVARG
jgi:hypothetical protein